MGIKGLASRLERYATQLCPEQLDGYAAVVDGPALAYYAHKLALASAASASTLPSYSDIVAEAIRWLASFEKSNIKVCAHMFFHFTAIIAGVLESSAYVSGCHRIATEAFARIRLTVECTLSAIYFDGALPTSKRAERLSRTEANNRRVQQFRSTYATVSCPIPTYLGSISYAFLAPALQEALLDSSFASKTRIVPGEADDWCALHAKDYPPSIIFTSDTDLVLYDYSADTLIVFLHDADLSAGVKAYSPSEIRKQLQVKSLVTYAYALLEGPQDSSNHLARKAQSVDQSSELYVDFARRYVAKVANPSYMSIQSSSLSALSQLDVRVSEFVHQALDGLENPFVYMPLLVEDPNQASAWNVGHDIRKLAYSLLARNQNTVVQEYRRKAQGITVQEVVIDSSTIVQTAVAHLERQIGTLTEWAPAKSVNLDLLWPLFGLSLVLAELNTPPAISLVQRILNGDFDNRWAYVHLTARIHAALYSLRMLGQVIRVWLALNKTAGTTLHTSVCTLADHMTHFPSIPSTLGVPGQAKRVVAEHDTLKGLIEEIYTSAGVELPTDQISNKKKKKKQMKETARKKKKAEQRMQGKMTADIGYGVLSDEE